MLGGGCILGVGFVDLSSTKNLHLIEETEDGESRLVVEKMMIRRSENTQHGK